MGLWKKIKYASAAISIGVGTFKAMRWMARRQTGKRTMKDVMEDDNKKR